MEGLDIGKLMGNIDGKSENVWKEVDKMMKGMKQPKTGSIEVPIVISVAPTEKDIEIARVTGKETVEIEELESVATISINKVESYYKIDFEEGERTVAIMDSGQSYELKLTYDKFKELLGVD